MSSFFLPYRYPPLHSVAWGLLLSFCLVLGGSAVGWAQVEGQAPASAQTDSRQTNNPEAEESLSRKERRALRKAEKAKLKELKQARKAARKQAKQQAGEATGSDVEIRDYTQETAPAAQPAASGNDTAANTPVRARLNPPSGKNQEPAPRTARQDTPPESLQGGGRYSAQSDTLPLGPPTAPDSSKLDTANSQQPYDVTGPLPLAYPVDKYPANYGITAYQSDERRELEYERVLKANYHTGILKGKVMDFEFLEDLPRVYYHIPQLEIDGFTNNQGEFAVWGVPPGKYDLVFRSAGHYPDTLKGLQVEPGKDTRVDLGLTMKVVRVGPRAQQGVRMYKTRHPSHWHTPLWPHRLSHRLQKARITRTRDRNLGDLVERTRQLFPTAPHAARPFGGNRGFGARHTNWVINGFISPGQDALHPGYRAFPWQAQDLNQLEVAKTRTAALPGEHTSTLLLDEAAVPLRKRFRIELGGAYRHNTTLEDQLLSPASRFDVMGLQGFERNHPSIFPPTVSGFSPLQQQRLLEELPAVEPFQAVTAQPDYHLYFRAENPLQLGSVRLGSITSAHYRRQFTRFTQSRTDAFPDGSQRFSYGDTLSRQQVDWGVRQHFSLEIDRYNTLTWQNTFLQSGSTESLVRNGLQANTGPHFQQVSQTQSNPHYLGQLTGRHLLNSLQESVDWGVGLSYTQVVTPDQWTLAYRPALGDTQPTVPRNVLNPYSANRFWSTREQTSWFLRAELNLRSDWLADSGRLVLGTYNQFTTENQVNRRLLFRNPLGNPLAAGADPSRVFGPELVGSQTLLLEEATRPNDRYWGRNSLAAFYLDYNLPLFQKKLWLNVGLRAEWFQQQFESWDLGGNPINQDDPELDLLPSASLQWRFAPRHALRLAYSRSVQRPTFQQLAPQDYADPFLQARVTGNPNLQTTQVDNFDLRWELRHQPDDHVAVGVWAKRFENPLERVTWYSSTGTDRTITWNNAQEFWVYAAEVEWRKSLRFINAGFFQHFSSVLQAHYALYELTPDLFRPATDPDRPLQGFAPWQLHTALHYDNPRIGLSFHVGYAWQAPTIWAAGEQGQADWYDLSRHLLSGSVAKTIGPWFEIRAEVQDALGSAFMRIQDSNGNGELETEADTDQVLWDYNPGQWAQLSLIFRF